MIFNRLPYLLSQREMSIRELSRQTGITYTTIWALYHMQRRSIQFGTLDSICRVLEVQPGEIYGHASANIDSEVLKVEERKIVPEPAAEKSAKTEQRSVTKQQPNDWRAW